MYLPFTQVILKGFLKETIFDNFTAKLLVKKLPEFFKKIFLTGHNSVNFCPILKNLVPL